MQRKRNGFKPLRSAATHECKHVTLFNMHGEVFKPMWLLFSLPILLFREHSAVAFMPVDGLSMGCQNRLHAATLSCISKSMKSKFKFFSRFNTIANPRIISIRD